MSKILAGASGTTLNENLRAPQELLFRGSFEDAKKFALSKEKYLVVNLQTRNDLMSIDQNRDLWRHESIKELIDNSFVFYQARTKKK